MEVAAQAASGGALAVVVLVGVCLCGSRCIDVCVCVFV